MKKELISLEEIKKIPNRLLLKLINKMKKEIKTNETWKDICKEYQLDIDELDYVPMTFADLDVSAKCDHGVIYFSYKLLCDGDFTKDYSYALHELTHFAQQTTGDKPTQSADDGEYLDNPYEKEGFQNQVEFIANEFGENEAEKYVDNLLKHHEVTNKKENSERKEELMAKV